MDSSGQPDEELVDANQSSRNWKGIFISLLVISVVLLLIVAAVVLKRDPLTLDLDQRPYTFEDLVGDSPGSQSGEFEPKRFAAAWTSTGDSYVFRDENQNIVLFECANQTAKILASNLTIKQLVGTDYKMTMSGEPSVLLFAYESRPVYRHSSLARYKIFNARANMSYDVQPSDGTFDSNHIQNARLASNGRALAFVHANNIHLMTQFHDGLKHAKQITFDGDGKREHQKLGEKEVDEKNKDKLRNGVADWLYEEEIFGTANAMWFSSRSDKLAYVKFNDSDVHSYQMPVYDSTQYNRQYRVNYPKPDTPNPRASVHVFDLKSERTVKLRVPDSIKAKFGDDYFVWQVEWLDVDSLIVVYVNREQTKSITVINDATTSEVLLFKEYPSAPSAHPNAWLLPTGRLIPAARYNYYFQIWPSENYQNIISIDSRNGESFPITQHAFDVTEILHFNERTAFLYYMATNGDPKQRHLFKKKVTDMAAKAVCLSCSNNTATARAQSVPHTKPAENRQKIGESDRCLYHAASFPAAQADSSASKRAANSFRGEHYVLECLGDRTPITYLKRASDDTFEYVIESNEKLVEAIASHILPSRAYLRVYLDNETNAFADAEITYPPLFDPVEHMYPVLVFTYQAPQSQLVDFQFRLRRFETFLAVNMGVIVAVMDGRGTGNNGERFAKVVAKQLGKYERADQIALAKAMRKELYTNDEQMAIWGWSFGGYVSGMTLLDGHSPFKCGIVGAPVTDWMLYDSAYTERYLGSYSANRVAYEQANLTAFAQRNENSQSLENKAMLLIHGTGDDNVHFQHSAILASYLRSTKLDFKFEVYPNVKHTPDPAMQRGLYQTISKFLLKCYDLKLSDHYYQLGYDYLAEQALDGRRETRSTNE